MPVARALLCRTTVHTMSCERSNAGGFERKDVASLALEEIWAALQRRPTLAGVPKYAP